MVTKRFILTVFILVLGLKISNAQFITIPDANFVLWLNNNGFASCMIGNMLDTTCWQVLNATSIDCYNSAIQDLTGITYFDNLTDLSCYNNQLTSLPILPPSLATLSCYSNQLTSLPVLPNSLTLLVCANNQLNSLPALPNSLIDLNCSENQLTSLPVLPNTLTFLACAENQLTSLPVLPNSLIELYCLINHLTSLPVLPNSLTVLDCNFNLLTSLPALPNSLTYLKCEYNQLTSLPVLPNSLIELYCLSNHLTSLPVLPNSLTVLDCNYNLLTSLPALPNSLTTLFCKNNQLTSLPALPNSLTDLQCRKNQLTSLPALPNSLTILFCEYNHLTSLPALPNSLTYLSCEYNHLTSLPALPNSLTQLGCSDNQLTSLPYLPNSLLYLDCAYNQLTSLPALNDTMNLLYINNNPGLTCLPPVQRVSYFEWDSTAINCLPNVITILGWAIPSIVNVPICSFFNSNKCVIYWNIGGSLYNDSNINCLRDSNETIYSNIKMNLYSNGILSQQTVTNSYGEYIFDADTGTYTYAPDTNSIYHVVCPASGILTSNLTALDSIDDDMDFALECKPGFDLGVTSILRTNGTFRPAGFASVKLFVGDLSNQFGLHCASGVSGEVKVLLSGPASFVSPLAGALTPVMSGDTLIYTITDFGLVNFNTSFGLYIQTDTTAQALQQVCFEVWVTPTDDNDSTNNHLTQCFNVVNSYDPNDKEVSPKYIQDANGEWLTYTIRFQNTGNAPALHIYIMDTLSPFVKAATFELLAYSHEPLTVLNGNAIRFNFAGINLPDSISDEPGSHGYVQYRVRSLAGLANNTSVENTAYIYFDFNPPVVTNTANSLVHCLESKFASQNICNGESFSFNNANLRYPGVYLDTINNMSGCDTIVYLNLNVTYQIISTTQIGNTLQVLNSGNYQWINCTNHTSIGGQTGNTFNPITNGNYAVIVRNGNCVDTSACINFVISWISEINTYKIKLTPNPANQFVLLENLPKEKCTIQFHDITGRTVLIKAEENGSQRFNISTLSKGIYLIVISGKHVNERLYFVKE